MAIKRAKRNANFTIINNDVYADNKLSWQAQGLLSYVLSKPDNWKISPAQLTTVTKNTAKHTGRDGVYAILKELISCGYVTRSQRKSDDNGQFGSCDYIFHDEPHTDEPYTAEPCPPNPTLINTDLKQVLINNKDLMSNSSDSSDSTKSQKLPTDENVKKVIDHFNHVTSSRIKYVKTHVQHISARLKDGYTVDDLCLVVSAKQFEWGNDPKMAQYIRTSTIFNPSKFDGYLKAAKLIQNQPAYTNKSSEIDFNDTAWCEDLGL